MTARTTAPPTHSPSGLFRMSIWESEFERSNAQLPRWYWDHDRRRRYYARWVEAEAGTLASRLSGLLRPDTPAETAGPASLLIESLARDIDWARRLEEDDPEEDMHRDPLRHAA
ncbi:hypothetical protein J2847_005414 [Azospirillum agricola]|uniref:hypothetical protein n=1 Tax=Azospirillum agricola TaxID=1720247 RepID=UPI001F3D4F52|nr:hypothetical protein [Azospirillum agricola]MBP2232089.1 hypothetical protein [Azospirillum agricola]